MYVNRCSIIYRTWKRAKIKHLCLSPNVHYFCGFKHFFSVNEKLPWQIYSANDMINFLIKHKKLADNYNADMTQFSFTYRRHFIAWIRLSFHRVLFFLFLSAFLQYVIFCDESLMRKVDKFFTEWVLIRSHN